MFENDVMPEEMLKLSKEIEAKNILFAQECSLISKQELFMGQLRSEMESLENDIENTTGEQRVQLIGERKRLRTIIKTIELYSTWRPDSGTV